MILQRGCFAEQTQYVWRPVSSVRVRSCNGLLDLFAFGRLWHQALARGFGLQFELGHGGQMRFEFLLKLDLCFLEFLRFRLALRQPLLDGPDLLGLRFELAARAFLIELQIRQFLARGGQLGFVAITGFLQRGVLCSRAR